jgi:hypothetical protein
MEFIVVFFKIRGNLKMNFEYKNYLETLKKLGYQSLTDVNIELNPSLCEQPSTACPDFYRDDR